MPFPFGAFVKCTPLRYQRMSPFAAKIATPRSLFGANWKTALTFRGLNCVHPRLCAALNVVLLYSLWRDRTPEYLRHRWRRHYALHLDPRRRQHGIARYPSVRESDAE
jgi:hypothetical protein